MGIGKMSWQRGISLVTVYICFGINYYCRYVKFDGSV